MLLRKILELCEKNGYLKILPDNLNVLSVKLGPTGALLQENLRLEWFYAMVVNRESNVFLSKGSFSDAFQHAKEMCQDHAPFGVAEIVADSGEGIKNRSEDTEEARDEVDFRRCVAGDVVLKTSMFVSPALSTQFFHQWQRQRKMWFRKFSASPGRYALTDISNDANATQNVKIQATYPWGTQLIESLSLMTGNHETLDENQLQLKDGRKKVQAHHIISNINLSTLVLNYLCDAYDEPSYQGKPRPLLKLHRKLAPYKISFSISSSKKSVTDELQDLALYLCKQLRFSHISCLLLPSVAKESLELQRQKYDQLGVPYVVVLNEGTLKNGLALLRSRDTTLKEQVHVTDLPTYVQQLFQNY